MLIFDISTKPLPFHVKDLRVIGGFIAGC